MARIPEAEIERLKAEVSLVRLVESSGIELKKQGKDYACRCPFHEDDTPSLIVTPSKNLFHCFGCGAAGGPIDWIMKARGISFRHAVELLREGEATSSLAAGGEPVKRSTVCALPAPVSLDADDHALLGQVVGYYHATLKQSPEALDYLMARGLAHPELIDAFKLGFANRTLGLRLPKKNRVAGAEMRGHLQRLGILRESGHEHFNGSLVVPVFDPAGQVAEIYGRKIRDDLREGTPSHLYLPGPHAGVWNEAGIAGSGGEVILCEALIDAMTFWCAGYRNVTASYGTQGFTDAHLDAFKRHGIARVLIAYDRDEPGERAAADLAQKLQAEGYAVYRILFPKGMDANGYALKMQPAAKALGLVIRKAEWLGEGKAPAPQSAAVDDLTAPAPALPTAASPLAAEAPRPTRYHPVGPATRLPRPTQTQCRWPTDDTADAQAATVAPAAVPEPTIASPQPPAPITDQPAEQTDTDLVLVYGNRRYRIRGWKKPLNPEALKINLLVSRDECFHIDTLDLYQAKARAAYIKQAGIELGEAEDVLKNDLGRVLLKLEELQSAHLQAALKKEEEGPKLTEAEQADALALLKSPDLLARILADFDACGVVGEETNKLVGYLAAVSRQLDKPLAVLIQSSSAAGKSSLMDAVLALMPDEAQVRYSAMTGQSLFYMGETNLKHKILAIAEEEGAAQASYALKLLQSDGSVTMASTGKDATTGLLTTHEYKVEGPVMLFLTTTAIDIDEELLNRCVVLTVNESREQTRAIHALQRKRQTLDGLLADETRDAILALHRNAQRLLQPLRVVNPYADQLTFMDDKTRTRRDHMKYLSLIKAIALLHQYQRDIQTVQHRGKSLRYIEVSAQDIATANRLAHDVLGRSLDELPPQTRKLLQTLHAWVKDECARLAIKQTDYRFTRRQVRELTGWGDTQLRIHLGRLAELEYLLEHGGRRGQLFHYELAYRGEGESGGGQDGQPFLMGLIDAGTLAATSTTASSRGKGAGLAESTRVQSGALSAPLREGITAGNAHAGGASGESDADDAQTAYLNASRGGSYRHPHSASASPLAAHATLPE